MTFNRTLINCWFLFHEEIDLYVCSRQPQCYHAQRANLKSSICLVQRSTKNNLKTKLTTSYSIHSCFTFGEWVCVDFSYPRPPSPHPPKKIINPTTTKKTNKNTVRTHKLKVNCLKIILYFIFIKYNAVFFLIDIKI